MKRYTVDAGPIRNTRKKRGPNKPKSIALGVPSHVHIADGQYFNEYLQKLDGLFPLVEQLDREIQSVKIDIQRIKHRLIKIQPVKGYKK